MQEKENILRILEETKQAIKKGNVMKLKELSNQTIHTASITQDPDNIAIAVIVYSLSKIIEKGYYRPLKWEKEIFLDIDNSLKSIKKEDEFKLKKSLNAFRKSLEGSSRGLKEYILDVFRKASINKASKIYEHGISMEKTASLLGITMFDLASYSGQTGVSNVPLGKTLDTKTRIKFAQEMFR